MDRNFEDSFPEPSLAAVACTPGFAVGRLVEGEEHRRIVDLLAGGLLAGGLLAVHNRLVHPGGDSHLVRLEEDIHLVRLGEDIRLAHLGEDIHLVRLEEDIRLFPVAGRPRSNS